MGRRGSGRHPEWGHPRREAPRCDRGSAPTMTFGGGDNRQFVRVGMRGATVHLFESLWTVWC